MPETLGTKMENSEAPSALSCEAETIPDLRKKFLLIAMLLFLFGGGILSFFIFKIIPIGMEHISESLKPFPQIIQNVFDITIFLNQYPVVLFLIFAVLYYFLFWWSKNLIQKFPTREEASKNIAKKFVLINLTLFIFFAALNLAVLVAMYLPLFLNAAKT